MKYIDRIIKLLISIIFFIFQLLEKLFLNRTNSNPVIITYHDVKDSQFNKFKNQMELLKKKN